MNRKKKFINSLSTTFTQSVDNLFITFAKGSGISLKMDYEKSTL